MPRPGLVAVATVGLAFPLALAFLHLVGSYWAWWDMGVNPAANSGVLVVLYGPIALAGLVATALVGSWAIARRLRFGRALLLVVGCQLAVVATAFAVEARRTGDSRWGDRGVSDFLTRYVERTAAGDLAPERRRPN